MSQQLRAHDFDIVTLISVTTDRRHVMSPLCMSTMNMTYCCAGFGPVDPTSAIRMSRVVVSASSQDDPHLKRGALCLF